MQMVIDEIRELGYKIDSVTDEEFSAKIEELRNDPEKVKYLQGVLHYEIRLDEGKRLGVTDNSMTSKALATLGFSWKTPDKKYLSTFMKFLDEMWLFQA